MTKRRPSDALLARRYTTLLRACGNMLAISIAAGGPSEIARGLNRLQDAMNAFIAVMPKGVCPPCRSQMKPPPESPRKGE